MKIKYLYVLILLFCALYVYNFVLSQDDGDLSNQEIKSKTKKIVVNKPLKKAQLKNNPAIVIDMNIDLGEFIDVDAEPLSQDNGVIDVGEYIDVEADPIPQYDTENIDIGDFVDVEQSE